MDSSAASSRYNIYSNPHKGLRLALGAVLAAAGRVDHVDVGPLDF